MSRHFLELEGANVLKTRHLLHAREAVTEAVASHSMIAVHGEAGLGKTFAIAEAVASLTVPVLKVVVQSRPTERFVVAMLQETLTNREARGSRYKIQQALLPMLAEQPRLVVFDEAQNLNRHSFEDLRYLHDDEHTQFGLIFVGGNGAWQVIEREPMVRSRLVRAVRFTPLSQEDVVKLIPTYHTIYAGVSQELIAKIDDEIARGYLRSWALFTHTAAKLCRRLQKDRIDDVVVRLTNSQLVDLA